MVKERPPLILWALLALVVLWMYPRAIRYMERFRRGEWVYPVTQVLTRPLRNACEGYYREYGHLPTGDDAEIIQTLRGQDAGGSNLLGKSFLNDSYCTNLNSQGQWLDGWRRPFQFRVLETNHIVFISSAEDAHFGPRRHFKRLFREINDDFGWGYVFASTNVTEALYLGDWDRYMAKVAKSQENR
jgi:hypothetical protein